MASQSSLWLDFALQQAAAESYLDQALPLDQLLIDGNNDRRVLSGSAIRGAIRFTAGQAQAFVNRYQVIDHMPNDSSGFSATLLFDRSTRQYTLAFRSTEYKLARDGGDFERDAAGADTEIKKYGFAFAQIDSMERYFSRIAGTDQSIATPALSAFREYLASQGRINLTGYSLGGHLAIVFAALHPSVVRSAVVFNSPGINDSINLSAATAYYRAVLSDPRVAENIVVAQPEFSETRALFNQALARSSNAIFQNIYLDPRHQWAIEATLRRFKVSTSFRSRPGLGGGLDDTITSVYGRGTSGDVELVANYGVHSAQRAQIFIEDQPDVEGLVGQTPLFAAWMNRLLAGKGDYGNTHSLVLLIDSLSLMSVIQETNPSLDHNRIGQIFAAASDERARGLLGTGQGIAEAASLERILDALRKIFLGNARPPTPFDPSEGGFGNFENRTAFHTHIASVRVQVANQPFAKIESIVGLRPEVLSNRALSDIAYRYALRELNPFVVSGLVAAYAAHNGSGELDVSGVPYSGIWTHEYTATRAAFLAWKNKKYVGDVSGPVRERGAAATDYLDRRLSVQVSVRNAAVSPTSLLPARQVVFGSDAAELGSVALLGGPRKDALFGGAGDDELHGGEDDDYLQGDGDKDILDGGIGDDLLVGGLGDDFLSGGDDFDRYVIGEGTDTVNDKDGKGLLLDTRGRRIAGLFVKKGNTYVFEENPTLLATKNSALTIFLQDGATVVIEGFDQGDLNITLADPKQPQAARAAPATTIPGTDRADRLIAPAAGATLDGGSFSDYLVGGAGDDRLLGGAGIDWLSGNLGTNRMEGGAGDDAIVLGQGEDYADGGDGADFITYLGGDKYPSSLDLVGDVFGVSWKHELQFDPLTGARSVRLEGHLTGIPVSQQRPTWQEGFVTRASFTQVNGQEIRGGGGEDVINAGPGGDLIYGDRGVGAPVLTAPSADQVDAKDFILAGAGDDTVFAEGGDDIALGAEGNDYIDAGTGNDWALGDAGDDVVIGAAGTDTLFGDAPSLPLAQHGTDYLDGGDGDDALWGGGGADSLFGGEGNDQLSGDDTSIPEQYQGADYLDGEGGDDLLIGFGGDDTIFGGSGADELQGNDGDDHLDGDDGVDTLFGDAGADELFGGAGNDSLEGGEGNDYLDGEQDNDVLLGDGGDDEIFGGAGNDRVDGGLGADMINGEDGVDDLSGGDGNDVLSGGAGVDNLSGDAGDDALEGGLDNDTLRGGAGNDVLRGGAGTDAVLGGGGDDTYVFAIGDGADDISDSDGVNRIRFDDITSASFLTITASADESVLLIDYGDVGDTITLDRAGGAAIREFEFADGTVITAAQLFDQLEERVIAGTAGSDILRSAYPNTTFDAGAGDDQVEAGSGNDTLLGGAGADTLVGNAGDDVVDGGPGADQLVGGRGSDTYLFGPGSGIDTIVENEAAPGEPNRVVLAAGITAANLTFSSTPVPTIRLSASGDEIRFSTWYSDVIEEGQVTSPYGVTAIDELVFADGTVWTAAQINARFFPSVSGTGARIGIGAADVLRGGINGDTMNGNAGDDTLFGEAGRDFLFGSWGADTLIGGADDDSLDGGAGPDLLDGGAGNDSLAGGEGSDTYLFRRGDGVDTITEAAARPANDTLVLTGGIRPEDVVLVAGGRLAGWIDVTLRGSSDAISFAAGNDLASPVIEQIAFDSGVVWSAVDLRAHFLSTPATADSESISGTPFGDVINALGGNDSISAGAGDDLVDGGPGNDTIWDEPGKDTYLFNVGSGQDTIRTNVADADVETVKFGAAITPSALRLSQVSWDSRALLVAIAGAADTLTIERFFPNAEFTFAFADGTTWNAAAISSRTTFALRSPTGTPLDDTLNGSGDIDNIFGGPGNDRLFGGAEMDSLFGDSGNDVLDGGAGRDFHNGGSGNDVYLFGIGSGSDSVRDDDPSDVDTIQMDAAVRPQDVTVTSGDFFRFALPTGDAIELEARDAFRVKFADGTLWSFNTNAPGVIVNGTAGNDTVSGRVQETIDGGAGDDTLGVGRAGTVVFGHGSGRDTAFFAGSGTLAFKPDVRPAQVVLQEVSGSTALRIALTDSADTLLAQSWFASAGARLDRLVFADGTVWDLAQILARLPSTPTATAGDDRLTGSDGADSLSGLAGNDVIDGGPGDDSLEDGPGDDRYLFSRGFGVDRLTNAVNTGSGFDRVEFDATIRPQDVVVSAIRAADAVPDDLVLSVSGSRDALTLDNWLSGSRFVEEVRFADGTVWNAATLLAKAIVPGDSPDLIEGSAFADTFDGLGGADAINGNAGNDRLAGGAGDDEISGDAGDDVLDGGPGRDRLYGGLGNDTYVLDDLADIVSEDNGGGTDTVSTPLSYTLPAGFENLTLTGTAAVNGAGNALANVITGNAAANVLDGGDGNDFLSGGGGADTLRGGGGDDTYVVDAAGAAIVENAAQGTDQVRASVTFTLSANLENLTLTGGAAINGTGNSAANTIVGNTAANVLDGGAGADALAGGAGNDVYIVDNAGDVVTESPTQGTDTVQSAVGYVLGAHVENLTLTGGAAINGTGNELDNVLSGNSAANVLTGLAGNDTYVVDVGDSVTERAADGIDTVRSAIAYTLGDNVENLVLTGTAPIAGTGNALDNALTGNAAANVLTGAAGNDTLDGAAGADTLAGGAGDDLYIVDAADAVVEGAGAGVDSVRAAVSYTLPANLENLTLIGNAPIAGTGNALDNVITGNAAANALAGLGGNDVYVVDNPGDVVTEAANEGTDLVQSSVAYTLGANVENLTLTGSAAIAGTGNALPNVIIGNAGHNPVDGGPGADTMSGGLGNDTYVVDQTGDVVIEQPDGGSDTVMSAIGYTLGSNLE
ncbi:MAG TPA: calcium-binding protein, partial [Burkholderiales bacterium]|nr:calcium-binding protein [Burkholderiales bacterium]